jgi:2-hydroxychromene-2-carboxylate isomerase
MAEPITFYFDFASPYAYLGSFRADALGERLGRPVDWRAILIGPAMQMTGGRPLTATDLRARYAREDIGRLARLYGVTFTEPPDMPIVSLRPARAFWWVRESQGPAAARAVGQALFDVHFGQGQDITSDEATIAVLEAAGYDGAAARDGINDPAIKDKVKAESQTSIELGVFGAPWVIVDGHNFWGTDRIDLADQLLGLEL